jgi:NAD(P)-dependent dehydrogenase (short-subunit alcohol dehydrogenase family)
VDAVVAKAGRIDVAINNAGYSLTGLAEAVTTEQARRIMDTNFLGPVRVNRAVLPHMRRQRSGMLIHISSGAGRITAPSLGFYCASKFALEALAESYSYELASQGIESVIVEPGPYETPVFGNMVTGCRRSPHRYIRRGQADPRKDQRGTFFPGGQCPGCRGRRSADYSDSCGREAAEVPGQPRRLRSRPDQRPLKASASQPARSLRRCC